ncbi:MAG: cyclic nucleotide-binding/CBS domain-containing protein [Chromatiaceae bacterium]|nr:MAG: cyclic nucleotide-binding/CBS domain-containing protein [Chromatiaceae bacterium]
MEIELIEIQEFLASRPPFDQLPEEAMARLPGQLSVRYFRRGTPFPPPDAPAHCLYILRRGAVELRNRGGELVGKLAEGDLCEMPCRFADRTGLGPGSEEQAAAVDADVAVTGSTAEDTLVYEMSGDELDALRATYPAFAEHFNHSVSSRLRKALTGMLDASTSGAALMTVAAKDLLRRGPICARPDISIREAAQIMSEQRNSALLLSHDDRLVGLITDRDLRNRCIATGLPTDRPVREIMTEKVVTIDADTPGFQALIQMTRLNVHHLPVLDQGRIIGMLSTTDLTSFQSTNAVYLVGDIYRAESVDLLVDISSKVPELQVHLVNSGATANQIGQAISAVTDAITKRLLELAEAELGPPPVPYAWMVGGSQARREQSSHSDQDNALLIADEMAEDDDAYFAALAARVNDGLHACGYVYCPGEVMAKNPKWRQPLKVWSKYYNTWIKRPDPMSLMLASVFFDLRALHDPAGLYDELHDRVLKLSRSNRIFIAYMASNALKQRPPLGFFRNFVLIHGGEHDRSVDVKHRGTVPIVDLGRVYAVSLGLDEINTIDRLQAAAGSDELTRDGSASLIDAYELVGTLRMRHQAAQLRRGERANNFLKPEQLSALERGHLKDAFVLINTMQETLSQRYQTARIP